MTLTFFELYTVYVKIIAQFFPCFYLLTCLSKDTAILLKAVNI